MPLRIIRQDITKISCDAIVCPTDRYFSGGGGVDLAIHQAVGEALDREYATLPPLDPDLAALTQGYGLDCRYIIHIAGPVRHDGDSGERKALRSCYTEALKLALERGCEEVAFPLISTGSFGYPKSSALHIATEVISEFLSAHELTVILCVYDRETYGISRALFSDISSYIDKFGFPDRSRHIVAYTPYPRGTKHRKRDVNEDMCFASSMRSAPSRESLEDYLRRMNDGFADTLFSFIDERGMTDVECYKRANVDKKTFSKIKCGTIKTPKKRTALAFAIALRLSLDETKALLASAGLALSHSSKFDMIVEYFIINGKYDIFEINEALFEFDQELLGSF